MRETDSKLVGLDQVLQVKEERAAVQAALRALYNATVVSVSVNMPGRKKYGPDTMDLLYYAVSCLRGLFAAEAIGLCEERIIHAVAGPAALMAVRGDAETIKRLGMKVEQETAFGRLLDIDVFDKDGRQISRSSEGWDGRRCFVCEDQAITCMRAGRHSEQEVAAAVEELVQAFRAAEKQLRKETEACP